MTRLCGCGRRSWARPCRTCRILARSPRWPGARMGGSSPVATSRAPFGCGRSHLTGEPPASRSSLDSGSNDRTIRLWEAQEGRTRLVFSGHSGVVEGLAFTPDGGSLLSGSEDGTMLLWEVERGLCVRALQGYAPTLYDLDWSPDGKELASVGSDTEVCLWEVEGHKPPRVLRGHTWTVYGVAWRPDGRVL